MQTRIYECSLGKYAQKEKIDKSEYTKMYPVLRNAKHMLTNSADL